jgi:hypothetical protein
VGRVTRQPEAHACFFGEAKKRQAGALTPQPSPTMSPPPSGPPLPFAKGFAASAVAACGAEALTLPLDMAKVRLQLQKTGGPGGAPKYRGLLGTVATVAREEGAAALWRGLVPALHRQVVYGGLRIGLYEPVKAAIGGDGLGSKIAAGLATGGLAIAVASPTDLVKVRMQTDGVGAARRYPSALGAYGAIVRTEGVRALWTGLGPNIGRNAVSVFLFSFFSRGFVRARPLVVSLKSPSPFLHTLSLPPPPPRPGNQRRGAGLLRRMQVRPDGRGRARRLHPHPPGRRAGRRLLCGLLRLARRRRQEPYDG